MTERIVMMDFDCVLQDAYENRFGVDVIFDKVKKGCVLVSVSGEREKPCIAHLEFLAMCQRALSGAQNIRELRQVGNTLRQVGTRLAEMNN